MAKFFYGGIKVRHSSTDGRGANYAHMNAVKRRAGDDLQTSGACMLFFLRLLTVMALLTLMAAITF